MSDDPLTNDEFAALKAAGYVPAGGSIADGGAFLKFRKDGVVETRTRAEWREVVAGLIRPGYTWEDRHGKIKVLAVAEGYAMCRRPRAVPFIMRVKEIERGGE